MRLPATPADKDAAPKTIWDRVIASTPVVMTVLATILAGISSSEMTRAQYQRSLAAQDQSKAGDQWGFFQARRLRNFEADNTLGLLQSLGGAAPSDAAELRDQAARVNADFARVEAEAERLQQTPAPAASEFLKRARDLSAQSKKISADLAAALGEAVTADAVRPPVAGAKAAAEPSGGDLDAAILNAAKDADAIEQSTKPTATALARLRDLTAKQAALARECERRARPLTDATDAAASTKPAAALAGAVGDLRSDADALNQAVTAAQLRYTAARYAWEAEYNQITARLYDQQVAHRGGDAERHQRRSKIFFYIMLLAQGGVTFSTLSMAMRKRSLLWTLAALAGLSAAAAGSYVYAFI